VKLKVCLTFDEDEAALVAKAMEQTFERGNLPGHRAHMMRRAILAVFRSFIRDGLDHLHHEDHGRHVLPFEVKARLETQQEHDERMRLLGYTRTTPVSKGLPCSPDRLKWKWDGGESDVGSGSF